MGCRVIVIRLPCLSCDSAETQGDEELRFGSSGGRRGDTVESKLKTAPGVQEG